MMNTKTSLVYRLNGQDELIYLNEEWVSFAGANDAADLLAENILGRPLWDFITDHTTAQLYRDILRNVRTGRPTRFTFRCDAPDARRLMQMTISGREGGEVEFAISTLQEEARPRQDLLDSQAPRAHDLLRICGWCNRVDVGQGRWEEVEVAVAALLLFERDLLPRLTHGMCAACYRAMMDKIAEHRARP